MIVQPKPGRQRDAKYLKWIRTQPCLAHGVHAAVRIEAHHIHEIGQKGMGTKAPDRRAIPLCPIAHRLYHEDLRADFESYYGLDLEAEILRLNREFDALYPRRIRRERSTKQRELQRLSARKKKAQRLVERLNAKERILRRAT